MNILNRARSLAAGLLAITFLAASQWARGDEPWSFILPEQRCVQLRSPSQLCTAAMPDVPRPPTVSDMQPGKPIHQLSLSEAINTGLANSEVIRVLAGITATSSGRTVYDVAITNTSIDQQRAIFDPTLRANQAWSRDESAFGIANPGDPTSTLITGTRNSNYLFDLGLSKRTLTGGVLDFGVNSLDNRTLPGLRPLNPQTSSSVDLSYTQPLLRGAGAQVNTIPIVLARIDTERSFFQYKSAVQRHVQGIISGYWQLVLARTNLWARQQQTKQLSEALLRAEARVEVGDLSVGELAQTRVAYENFRASLVAAEADVLSREAALRNILGFPPYDAQQIIPVSPLLDEKLEIDWQGILDLAETQRPDIIELKLILEADLQRLVLSRNRALPQLDGVALYRWDGLNGEMPNGGVAQSGAGQFTDFNLGINFSVPLGLRADRALLRQQELVIRRDRANLDQGLHAAIHTLALNIRNLEQYYEQYVRYQAVREAATLNLEQQIADLETGRSIVIVALQAVVDWGNAVSNEAQALVLYNTELAALEVETGSILEAHGIAFFEERFGSIGPLGRLAEPKPYPMTTRPTSGTARYESGEQASEEYFDLQDPLEGRRDAERIEAGPVVPDFVPPIVPQLDSGLPPSASSRRVPAKPAAFHVRAAETIKGIFSRQ